MPILSIISQPGNALSPSIHAAYRPIVFLVKATRTDNEPQPPRVYCDIYINDQFFKTISNTQYKAHNTTNTDWEFDISSVCQQFFSFHLPENGGSLIEASSEITAPVFCRFRSSGYDVDGFLISEDIPPKQGTGIKQPVNGTGFTSESFHVINAILQHEHNQDLQTHLLHARHNANYDTDTYPLAHRPNRYTICKGDSDHFPFVHLGSKPFVKIVLNARNRTNGQMNQTTYNIPQTCSTVISNLTATVVPGNDVRINFTVTGDAKQFEWSIDGGVTWTRVYTNAFFITWEDLLVQLITEAGMPIETQDGQVIIPEGVDPYKTYDIIVRPRCTNGAYGTSATTQYTISEPLTCDPPVTFSFVSNDYTNALIKFNIALPAGKTKFQLEWRTDFGNGFYSNPTIENYDLGVQPFGWPVNPQFARGTVRIRIRTNCSTATEESYSAWSFTNVVVYDPPATQLTATISSIVEFNGSWLVACAISGGVSVNDILINGYFVGDGTNGMSTFNFTCIIIAGNTSGTAQVMDAAAGGGVYSSKITSVNPNPTSDGKTIIF